MSDISNNAAPAEEPGTPKNESFLRKLLRWIIWFIVIVYLILGCAWLAARYFLAPYIEGHKAQIENKISETVSAPVTFGSVDAGWVRTSAGGDAQKHSAWRLRAEPD